MTKANRQFIIRRMSKGLHKIQDDVKIRLDIDHTITDCVSRPRKYTIDNLLELNMKLFLDYSNQLINSIKRDLNKLRLVPTGKYWASLNNYIKLHKQLSANPKTDDIQINAAEELYNNLVVERDELNAAKPDFEMLKKKIFLHYLVPIEGAVTVGYFAVINTFYKILDLSTVVGFFVVLYLFYWLLKKYFNL